MKLQMLQRLAKIRRLHNLDDQYYYDDNDRLALSRVTDLERSDALEKRYKMIKLKSEMIAMSHEIKKKAAKKEEQKKETTAKQPLAAKNSLPAKNTGNNKRTLG